MLEKPDIPEEKIITCLREKYGLSSSQVKFLPLGADINAAVYRVYAENGMDYFFKLKTGPFHETSVAIPAFLRHQGIEHIISPLVTLQGQLWDRLEDYKVILYPYIEGTDAYHVRLSSEQWVDFGRAVHRIHAAELPLALKSQIRKETYSPSWRNLVRAFLENPNPGLQSDPASIKLASILKEHHETLYDIVQRAERYARNLQARSLPFTLCHADLHPGNLLVTSDRFYIVDWDDTILASIERDLMFAGGGQGFIGSNAQLEENLFSLGYGNARIDLIALAYYRYERIIQDIAVTCEQIFLSKDGAEDREQSIQYIKSNFLPGNTISMAYRSDPEVNNARRVR